MSDCHSYGTITKVLSKNRFNVLCKDGIDRLCYCIITKKNNYPSYWLSSGNIVLVRTSRNKDNTGEIVRKLSERESSLLEIFKYIPTNIINCERFAPITFDDNYTGPMDDDNWLQWKRREEKFYWKEEFNKLINDAK